MSVRAKLFKNGGSQAVRLPKEFRFEEGTEVVIRREGRRIVLEPVEEWSAAFRSCLGGWDEEVERPRPEDLRDPFE